MTTINTYNPIEEKINVWTHALGIVISLVCTVLLIIKGIQLQSLLHLISYSIYGLSMIILFTASTLYHSSNNISKRKKLKVFDHAAIYFIIAGTYTPFTLLILKGNLGIIIFSIAWIIGFSGIGLKLFFTGKFKLLSTLSYLGMGWLIVFVIKPLTANMPSVGLNWLILGGAFYTLGAILYSIKRIPYNHAIFHLFVLGGCFSLFIPIYLFS